jgi:tetratricopeptide (TPR) repeat protein
MSGPAGAQVLQREDPLAGAIISTRGGEEGQLVPEPSWRGVAASQDLKAGDVLRTNATGTLAIVFADDTQIRLGRNATLVVKEIGPGGPSRFGLTEGSLWARAPRGQADIVIDTPAASAAVRGTDWTLAVEGARTSLTVLDGAIELFNPQGALTVTAGQSAVATIGSAPTRIVLVQRPEREQLLFYLSLRDTFALLPPTPLTTAELRRERARLAAVPPEARTAADWLAAAEVGLALDGFEAARSALAEARARPLSAGEAARADLVAGLIAGAERRWSDAAVLLARAEGRLDPSRRVVAAYASFFAEALADPSRAVTPPDPSALADTPAGAVAEAFIAAYLGDFSRALAILRDAERRFPEDARLPAIRAQVAILANDEDEIREASARAIAIDPEEPEALRTRARVRAEYGGDLDGALADLRLATEIAPGDSGGWNDLALVQDARDAVREAEAAARRAIREDPEDPVPRSNLAILLLDQSRVEAARKEIETALALDPAFYAALVARGRLKLQTGDTEGAIDDLLAASVANPLYSNALLALAVAYYDAGEVAPARQQLDIADRLDPNDPIVSLARAAMALDLYEADEAIRASREAVRRNRNRGGDFAPLGATREGGSTLAESFRFLGLDAWAQYYGDVVFDRFDASGYFDRSIVAAVEPFVDETGSGVFDPDEVISADGLSLLVQGLLLEPLAIAAPERGLNIFRAPFSEVKVGGGPVLTDGAAGGLGYGELQAFSNTPFPVSVLARGELRTEPSRFDDDDWTARTGTAFIGAEPAPYTRLLAFAAGSVADRDLPGPITDPTLEGARSGDSVFGGLGLSHTFGERNVGQVLGVVSWARGDSFSEAGDVIALREEEDAEQLAGTLGASHLIGIGPADIVYGVEGGAVGVDSTLTQTLFIGGVPVISASETTTDTIGVGRAFADVLVELGPDWRAQAGLTGAVLSGEAVDVDELGGRAGLAWAPADWTWLRVGVSRETLIPASVSLAPQTTVGLSPAEAPVAFGGTVEAVMARWDAEWSPRIFTSVEYQHQELDRLSFFAPLTAIDFEVEEGRLDRLQVTANVWLGGGFGASATYARTWSEIVEGGATLGSEVDGNPLPYIPHDYARGVLTWQHPTRVTASAAVTYLGDRRGDAAGTRIADATLVDAGLDWESPDRRLFLSFDIFNILDDPFEIAPDTPGWGRTAVIRGEVRF